MSCLLDSTRQQGDRYHYSPALPFVLHHPLHGHIHSVTKQTLKPKYSHSNCDETAEVKLMLLVTCILPTVYSATRLVDNTICLVQPSHLVSAAMSVDLLINLES